MDGLEGPNGYPELEDYQLFVDRGFLLIKVSRPHSALDFFCPLKLDS